LDREIGLYRGHCTDQKVLEKEFLSNKIKDGLDWGNSPTINSENMPLVGEGPGFGGMGMSLITTDHANVRNPSIQSDESATNSDIPPELSPLDAFALQSHLLAKQLDSEKRSGRRISRLPPLAATDPIYTRPGYLRNQSADDRRGPTPLVLSTPPHGRGDVRRGEAQKSFQHHQTRNDRPLSSYPQLSGVPIQSAPRTAPVQNESNRRLPGSPGSTSSTSSSAANSRMRQHPLAPSSARNQRFAIRREQSPESLRATPAVQSARLPTNSNQLASPPAWHPMSARLPPTRQRFSPEIYSDNRTVRHLDSATSSSPLEKSEPSVSGLVSALRASSISEEGGAYAAQPEITNKDLFIASATVSAEPHIFDSSEQVPSTISENPIFISSDSTNNDIVETIVFSEEESLPVMSPALLSTRSPSVGSEYSIGGSHLRSPHGFNFSRPISRASRPSLEYPSRQPSADSRETDSVHTPISSHSIEFVVEDEGPAPAVVYSSYSLPRGRALQRNSIIFQALNFNEDFLFDPTPNSIGMLERPLTNDILSFQLNSGPRPSLDASHFGSKLAPILARSATDPAVKKSTLSGLNDTDTTDRKNSISTTGDGSASSGNTIRAQSLAPSTASARSLSADECVERGIECHEQGSTKESTYYLRRAAYMGHPTGMLFYALACRHGWGMKADPELAIEWLRKAVDSAGLEIAEEGDLTPVDGAPDSKLLNVPDTAPTVRTGRQAVYSKARRARFGLVIYELGMSYLNGWGTPMDKPLALRCFEIAGQWGDADALAEVGYCYAQGIGCKKDLVKAASFYREAEKHGVSMVGNSWIHKPKYMSPRPVPPPPKQNSPKSGTSERRVLRKKSMTEISPSKSFSHGSSRPSTSHSVHRHQRNLSSKTTYSLFSRRSSDDQRTGRSLQRNDSLEDDQKSIATTRTARSKSRTRSFFSRKKSVSAGTDNEKFDSVVMPDLPVAI
jgi:hypothetical protein